MWVLLIVECGRTIKITVVHLHGDALLAGLGRSSDESSGRSLLLPIESGSLHRGLAGVTKLLLPARVDLIGVFLESQEGALELLVCLGILDHAIRQRDLTIGATLPLLPGILALGTRDGTLLWSILVAERATTGREDHIGMAQILEEGWQAQRVHASRDDRSRLLHALPLLVPC